MRGRTGSLYSLKFDEDRVRYSYQGDRRKPGGPQKFALVLIDIVRRCPHGFFPASTRAVAAGQGMRVTRVRQDIDYENYLKWILCCVGWRLHAQK